MEDALIPTFLTGLITEEVGEIIHYNNWIEFLTSSKMISTYVFFTFSFCIYLLIRRSIRKQEIKQQEKEEKEKKDGELEINKLKIKRIFLRNGFVLFLLVGLFFIWKDEIKTTFFSISFAIMAIVVLFKEVLLNILSSFIISMSKPYVIGDVIEYKGVTGTVVDRTIFNTKILIKKEGHNTGKEYVIPNSGFITNELVVLTRFGNYSTNFIDVHVDKRDDLIIASKLLKHIAEEVTLLSHSRGDKLNNWKKNLKKKESMDIPSHKPYVTIHPSEKPYITLKFTCDLRSVFFIKQEILERYLEEIPFVLAEFKQAQKKQIADILEQTEIGQAEKEKEKEKNEKTN